MSKPSRLALAPTWPFDAARLPFYYGWVILALSTIGFLLSIPGQTMGMGVFTEHFVEAFDLSRVQLSFAYLLGTATSAMLLTRAGRLYDRVGARLIIAGASFGLGLFVAFIATIDRVSRFLAGIAGGTEAASGIAFALITLGYFGVRFTGQGVLTSASRNLLLVWFERRRGLVNGIRSLFVAMGFSIAPLLLAQLIIGFEWRGALFAMAIVLALIFPLLALVLVRNNPKECGLRPDGVSLSDPTPVREQPSATLAMARKNPVFWIYTAGIAVHALFGTALTFHVVDVFAEAGRSSTEAFAYFIPAAIVSTSVNFLGSAIADHIRLKPLLLVMLVGFIAGAWGMLHLHTQWGYWLLVAGFGVGGGLWGVLSNLAFIRFFGPNHLGEISGLNTSVTVLASALGPFLFSFARDYTGSYAAAQTGCLAALVVLLILSVVIPQKES